MKTWGLLRFCDVSKWQSVMDWPKAAKKLDFAFAKTSQGVGLDPQWVANHTGAKAAGLPCGGYHYYDSRVSWQAQADFFLTEWRKADTGLLPAIDLEKQREAAANVPGILNMLADVVAEIKARPIIYTGPDFILTYLTKIPELADYPLWISHYATDKRWPLPAPRVPLPWFPLDFWGWQFSADGNGQGRYYGAQSNAIDLNVAWELPTL